MALRHDGPALAEVREFINHLREPRRLRRSDFVARYLGGRIDIEADDYRLARCVRAIINEAVAGAPQRARAILERTAFEGDSCRAAARALGISERQAHRDRNVAIATIASYLQRVEPARLLSDVEASDVLDVRLGQATMLGELGLFDRAESTLNDVVRSSEAKPDKAFVLSRLARLCIARGRLGAGRAYAESALAIAGEARSTGEAANARGALGRLEIMAGNVGEGSATLRVAVHALRPLAAAGDDARAREALAEAYLGRWEAYRIAGFPREADAAARQAADVVRELELPALSLRLGTAAAVTDSAIYLWSDPDAVEAQTDAHYAKAVASGSTCGTLLFALYRSYVAHYKGRFEEQAALLRRLHPIADELAGCTAKIYFLVELGVASGLGGKTAEARRALDSAAEDAPADYPRLRGYVGYSRATVELSLGNARGALANAEAAIDLLSHPRDEGLLGPCVAKKAQALAKLGRFAEALEAAERARDLLGTAGQPVIVDDTQRMIAGLKRRLRA